MRYNIIDYELSQRYNDEIDIEFAHVHVNSLAYIVVSILNL